MKKNFAFTKDEIKVLSENPYTLKLTPTRLSLTLEAKYFIAEQARQGVHPKEIIANLGYDPAMLGKDRIHNMVRSVMINVEKGQGLHEGYLRKARKRLDDTAIEGLDCNAVAYAKLKNEVIYLRKEVEFLKKISQRVIFGKRGK